MFCGKIEAKDETGGKRVLAYISLKNVTKTYHMGEVTIKALSGVDFEMEKGELCVVVGPSGAGKTTLLNILGGMDSCTSGEIVVDGAHIEAYDRQKLTGYRRDTVGFVFQFYNLVQNLTALENVELAAQICREPLGSPGGGAWRTAFQFSGAAFRRGAAARSDCTRACKEPEAYAV